MTGRLAGTGVLVTRPADRAAELAERITAEGGHAWPLPAVTIEPEAAALPADQSPPDIAVFVSRNAVRYGLDHVPDGVTLAAIGPSTADALAAAGRPATLLPDGFDSESLLGHPALREVAGRRILIVKGVGGRDALRRGLEARDARVLLLDVYRRRCPEGDAGPIHVALGAADAGRLHVYTATSVEILENLGRLFRTHAGERGEAFLRETALVTASRRVITLARQRNHAAPRLLAPGPDDASLIEALAEWRRGAEEAGGSTG